MQEQAGQLLQAVSVFKLADEAQHAPRRAAGAMAGGASAPGLSGGG
jgi:hypothetical protein